MRPTFQYSVITYQHSQITGERYPIGLFFAFLSSKRLHLSFPSSLIRLSHFQVDFDASFIRSIIKNYQSKTRAINYSVQQDELGFSFENLDELIQSEFIVPDSSAIRFSEWKTGLVPSSEESLIDYYEKLYFRNYQAGISKDGINEQKILQSFHQKTRVSFQEATSKYLKEEVQISGRFFEEKFDYGWQNGSFNLVSPLSFDLQKEDSIKKKVQQQIGIVSNLEETIKANKLKIDFIVARPSSLSLSKSFESALEVLHGFEEDKLARVIEFGKSLDEYVEEIKDTAKPSSRTSY